MTWPFRAIERVEARVVEWTASRRRRFRHTYRHSKVIAPLVEMIVWGLLLPFRLVWQLVTAPFRMFRATSQSLTGRRSREWMNLVYGLPAVVAGLGAFSVLMMLTTQAEELPVEYLQQAQTALDNEYFDQAEVYLHRALQLDPDSDSASYLLATTLQHTGQPKRAMAILDSLAPDNRRGYAHAHYRKAQVLFGDLKSRRDDDDPDNDPTPEEVSTLLQHVDHARGVFSSTTSARESADLDYFRGIALLSLGRHDEALEFLEKASEVREELNYELMRVYIDLKNASEAQQKLEQARKHFSSALQTNRADSKSRILLAELASREHNHLEAIRLLEEGVQLSADDEQLQQALATSLVYQSMSIPPATGMVQKISLLERALEIDPACGPAFDRLVELARGPNRQVVKERLLEQVSLGASAPLSHFALGVLAWEEEDSDSAFWHMERAYKLDPRLSKVGNNLAWVLAHDVDPPQPDRALALINSVLETHPDQLAFVETRGQIYVKLGRWEEALDDLERALPEYRYNAQLHMSLGTVYEHLGRDELASRHRKIAIRLQQSEASPR